MKRQRSSPTTPKHKRPKTNRFSVLDEVESPDSEEGWTKVQKRKEKKEAKKADVKTDATRPQFKYINSAIMKRQHPVGIDELRQLIIHILADASPPTWLHIQNTRSISKVVALLVPGLTPELLSLPPIPTSATANPDIPLAIPMLPRTPEAGPQPNLPFIAATFSHACPTRAPGDAYRLHSIHSTFFQTPVSIEERNKRLLQRALSGRVKNRNPLQYALTLKQMLDNDYPIPSYMADVFQKPPGWHETPEPREKSLLDSPASALGSEASSNQKIYAVDCEMCLTEDGNELARVCIVDFHTEAVIYDELVRPSKPITDYLTRWSGITAEALAPVNTTLAQVQEHILRLLSPPPLNPFSSSSSPPPPTPILLGHSLESDLKVLKICHPLCIDTALLYHHPRGGPFKPGLAWLTKKWCGRDIQTAGDGGHDPEEDARACIELLKKKIELGPNFGEFTTDTESIFERMARSTRRGGGAADGIKSAVVDIGNPAMMHGNKANTCVGCKTDEEILNGLLDVIPSHDFTFGRFMALANIMGYTTPKPTPDAPPPPPPVPPSPEALKLVLDTLDTQLRAIYSALPSRTALILFTGHSDPRPMLALNVRKSAFDSAMKNNKTEGLEAHVRWTANDDRELQGAVQLAKRGLLFLGVKH